MDQKTLQNELKNCKVREGPLYKRSKFLKEWRQRWIVLTMNYLFTFTNKSCKEVTDIIDLKQIKSYKSYLRKDQEMIPAGFKVRSEDQQFYFCGRNANQKWSWIVTLQRLMDYKYVGSSTYNNIEFVKTRGFTSQVQFENGGKIQKTSAPQSIKQQSKKSAEQAKKEVDNEVQMIMKELQNQKQQLKQKQLQFTEKEKILKQQELALKKQQQQKMKELEKKLSQVNTQSPKKVQQVAKVIEHKVQQVAKAVQHKAQQKLIVQPVVEQIKKQQNPVQIKQPPKNVSSSVFGPKVSELKSLYEQKMAESSKQTNPVPKINFQTTKMTKKKSVLDELHSLRSRTITNLFEQFHDQSPQPEALKFTLDFLVKMASDSKFGYYAPIVAETKSHKNRKFLAQTFVELITDYRDMQNCDLVAKFIQICVFQAPGFFDEKHISLIQNKLLDFLLAVQDQSKIEVMLKNIFIVNKMHKYQKNEVVKAKINRIIKESKKEENKNWARKLVDQF